jgi:hypothetical protein
MKYLSLGVLVFVSAASVGAQQYPAPKSDDKAAKDSLTVTGCVGAGTEPNTFILTKSSAAAAAPAAPTTPPAATAPAPAADAIVYRLDSPEKVKGHLGHQIEVTGTLDETKTAEAKPAPDAEKTAGTSGKQPSLKLKVKEVKMLSATCS